MEEVRVFFVDDDPGIRDAARRTLELAGMIVTTFSSAEECLSAMEHETGDVVVTDVKLGGIDGIAMLCQISYRFPWVQSVVVTAYGDAPMAFSAAKAKVSAFLDKPLDSSTLVAAIHKAVQSRKKHVLPPKEALSQSETEVLRLILEGKTCKEMTRIFHRSVRTIETHRHHIMRKLGAKNTAQLVQRAYELGFEGGDGGQAPQ